MSMTLKKIELWNIRSHEHFVFEPDPTGITSVSGVNGAGKSTIVDSFGWALYGIRPSGVKNKMLIREGVSLKGKEKEKPTVKVEAIIEVNGTELKVSRAIVSSGGATECNVYGRVDSSGEFNHLAGPAVSSAEAYIKQALQMDDKGFLTAILIQQKQVDQIVVSSPKERGEVIEKLTGIQSITNSISFAKEEAKEYQQAANSITVEDTDTLKEEIETLIQQGKDLRGEVDKQKEAIIKREEEYKKSEAEFNAELEKNEKADKISRQLELLKNNKQNVSDELDRITQLLLDYKKENNTTISIDTTEIEKEMARVEKELSTKRSEKTNLEKEINKINSYLEKNKELEQADIDSLKSNIVELIKAKESFEEEEATLIEKVHETQALIKQSKKSLDTVNSGDNTCPVCKAHIDDPEQLREEVRQEIEDLENKLKETTDKGRKVSTSIKEKAQGITSLEATVENVQLFKAEQERLKELSSQLEVVNEAFNEIELDYKAVNIEYKESLKLSARADEINRAKARMKEITEQLSVIDSDLVKGKAMIDELNALSNTKINSMRTKLSSTKDSINKDLIEFNKKEEELKYLRLKVKDQKERFALAVESEAKHSELVKKMTNASMTASVLSKFKEERIKYAIPTLEMYASIVLSKFTEGKFTKLELDAKFNTSVHTADGNIRPISQLSGGELSAAAIALRVGISMLLNDGENNVLILDEILVSMDEQRAKHIIETISSMINCQIIFIAHNPEIQNIADKNIEIG